MSANTIQAGSFVTVRSDGGDFKGCVEDFDNVNQCYLVTNMSNDEKFWYVAADVRELTADGQEEAARVATEVPTAEPPDEPEPEEEEE